jgi:short-subunit dehydrogenase
MLELNYNVIAVSRDTTTLEELNVDSEKLLIIPCDLSKNENVFYLFDEIEDFNITHIFNNAGLGLIGSFAETDISKEIAIINTNISALVILTKLFLQKFNNEKTNGKIINIGSLAGNVSGPLQSVYYASKAFVNNFTESVQYEMKQENNYGKLILVLPGQVKTNFRKSAGGKVQEGYNVY